MIFRKIAMRGCTTSCLLDFCISTVFTCFIMFFGSFNTKSWIIFFLFLFTVLLVIFLHVSLWVRSFDIWTCYVKKNCKKGFHQTFLATMYPERISLVEWCNLALCNFYLAQTSAQGVKKIGEKRLPLREASTPLLNSQCHRKCLSLFRAPLTLLWYVHDMLPRFHCFLC